MCECGCYLNDRSFWLPAPDGARYVITIATPCEDCETPVGIILKLHKPTISEDEPWCEDFVIPLELKPERDTAIPLVYPHKLFQRFMRLVCKMFGVKQYHAIPDELWDKINAFDPDEVKSDLYHVFYSSIRQGVRKVTPL